MHGRRTWAFSTIRSIDVRQPGEANPLYQAKWGYTSPHTLTLDRVAKGSRVLDVGCASGYMSRALADRGCEVTGIDLYPPPPGTGLKKFIEADLSTRELPVDAGDFQYILLLDVIEHLVSPEGFVDALRRSRKRGEETRVIVSTGNVAFLVTRFMLLLGYFHYGARGILDMTHTRLFTFATLRDLFQQGGYRIEEVRGHSGALPAGAGRRDAGPVAGGGQPFPDPAEQGVVLVSDLHGRAAPAHGGMAATGGEGYGREEVGAGAIRRVN